jgi:hypothetical protein
MMMMMHEKSRTGQNRRARRCALSKSLLSFDTLWTGKWEKLTFSKALAASTDPHLPRHKLLRGPG